VIAFTRFHSKIKPDLTTSDRVLQNRMNSADDYASCESRYSGTLSLFLIVNFVKALNKLHSKIENDWTILESARGIG